MDIKPICFGDFTNCQHSGVCNCFQECFEEMLKIYDEINEQ